MARTDDLEGLDARARARLDSFATAFDRIDASEYMQLSELAPDERVVAAQDAAVALIGSGPRRDAVRAAVDSFIDAAAFAYSRRPTLTDTLFMHHGLPDRAEDRVRFLAGVERAVVGLILWDELEDDQIAALIGPWATFVEGED